MKITTNKNNNGVSLLLLKVLARKVVGSYWSVSSIERCDLYYNVQTLELILTIHRWTTGKNKRTVSEAFVMSARQSAHIIMFAENGPMSPGGKIEFIDVAKYYNGEGAVRLLDGPNIINLNNIEGIRSDDETTDQI